MNIHITEHTITPLRMKVTHLSKRPEKPPRDPLWFAGGNPRSKGCGECTSVASTQGALVVQDTLNTRAIHKPISNNKHRTQTSCNTPV
jgi:hypothetical protein